MPGVPAWAAVLIAVGATTLGFLIDALGDESEPTGTFSAFYVLGCLAAVCAVRLRGLFTAMVLPPLLLFVAVPVACQFLSGRGSTSIKDVLLNLAIPLVQRFPTMLLATVLVLAVGAARIVLHRRAPATAGDSGRERRPARRRNPSTLAETSKRRPRRAAVEEPPTEVDLGSPARRRPPAPARGRSRGRGERSGSATATQEPRGRTAAPRGEEPRAGRSRGGEPARAAAPRGGEPGRSAAPRGGDPARSGTPRGAVN